jgi:putative transposase
MVRPLRIEYPGCMYHITARGNGRGVIYLCEEDRILFLDLLCKVKYIYSWEIYSYCLMDNHYHLLIETPLGNLSKGMHYINGVYSQKFNKKYNRVGHVLQGRYKSILVDKDSYFLELARYIVLNPVRAFMVSNVSEWQWSSYLATCEEGASQSLVNTDYLLSNFATSRNLAISKYKQFVADGVDSNPFDDLKNQIFLGSEKFVTKMQENIDSGMDLIDIPKDQYLYTKQKESLPIEEYVALASSRNEAIYLSYTKGNFTLREIGKYFKLHYSRISKIVNEWKMGKA